MPFEFSCFISYRHVEHDLGRRFVESFLKALKSHIELELDEEIDVYIDEERLRGGYLFNDALAEAICKSVCMIVIFTPRYFSQKKTYCAREYRAMQELEAERLKLMSNRKHGLIIPVVLKGSDSLPDEIKAKRQFYDFSHYSLVRPEILEHEVFNEYMAQIARYIRETHDLLSQSNEDPCSCCAEFELPAEESMGIWLEQMKPSKQKFPR